MTGLNHTATGAVIALSIKQPFLALPLAFASHFVLDALPHFGIDHADKAQQSLLRKVVTYDSCATVLLILTVYLVSRNLFVVACMLITLLPDSVWFVKYAHDRYRGQAFSLPKDVFSRFHKRIQWGERPWAWRLELVWAVVALTVLSVIL